MNTLSGVVTGVLAMILGVVLIFFGFSNWMVLIYGVVVFVVGVFLFFNKKEDDIEKIKVKGGRKNG